MRCLPLILTLMSLVLPQIAQSAVYKTIDHNGRVHYSQQPMANQSRHVSIETSRLDIQNARTINNRYKDMERWVEARREEREIAKQRAANFKRRQLANHMSCSDLQQHYSKLKKHGLAWFDVDHDGKRHFFTKSELLDYRSRLGKYIGQNCH